MLEEKRRGKTPSAPHSEKGNLTPGYEDSPVHSTPLRAGRSAPLERRGRRNHAQPGESCLKSGRRKLSGSALTMRRTTNRRRRRYEQGGAPTPRPPEPDTRPPAIPEKQAAQGTRSQGRPWNTESGQDGYSGLTRPSNHTAAPARTLPCSRHKSTISQDRAAKAAGGIMHLEDPGAGFVPPAWMVDDFMAWEVGWRCQKHDGAPLAPGKGRNSPRTEFHSARRRRLPALKRKGRTYQHEKTMAGTATAGPGCEKSVCGSCAPSGKGADAGRSGSGPKRNPQARGRIPGSSSGGGGVDGTHMYRLPS